MLVRAIYTLVFIVVVAQAGLAAAQSITPSLSASRIAGVAPLAVHFDATATTHSSSGVTPFHDLYYSWDFGDPQSGTWSHTGKSRNEAAGPVSAHVFDSPGTYTVALTVHDTLGSVAQANVQIQVQSPDVAYSGSTACVSASGNFGGCPSGALLVTSADFDGQLDTLLGSGHRRILFRRSDTFQVDQQTNLPAGPGTIGAFGPGQSKAKVQHLHNGTFLNMTQDWRVIDIDIDGPATPGSRGFGDNSAEQVLLYRVQADSLARGVTIEGIRFSAGNDQIFIIDSDFGPFPDAGENDRPIAACGSRWAIMGNTLHDSDGHLVRIFCSDRFVFSHNHLTNSGAGKLNVKWHAPSSTHGGGCSRLNQVSDNVVDGSGSGGLFYFGPSSSTFDMCVEDTIIARNYVKYSTKNIQAMRIMARRMTIRNNLFDLSNGGVLGTTAISIEKAGSHPSFPLSGNRVYNNTCHSQDPGNQIVRCLYDKDGTQSIARNNLLHVTNATGTTLVVSGSGGTFAEQSSNCSNRGTADCSFSGSPFVGIGSAPQRFQLDPTSSAAGVLLQAGASSSALDDFSAALRPAPNAVDIGAFQGMSAVQPPAAPILLP